MRDPGNEVEESHVSQTNRVFLKRGLQPHRGSCLCLKMTQIGRMRFCHSGTLSIHKITVHTNLYWVAKLMLTYMFLIKVPMKSKIIIQYFTVVVEQFMTSSLFSFA